MQRVENVRSSFKDAKDRTDRIMKLRDQRRKDIGMVIRPHSLLALVAQLLVLLSVGCDKSSKETHCTAGRGRLWGRKATVRAAVCRMR